METRAQYVARRRRELEAERRSAELKAARRDQRAKEVAGAVANVAGIPIGAGRGLLHDGQAIGDGISAATRLVTGDKSAWRAIGQGAEGVANYVTTRASQPQLLKQDARRVGLQWNKDMNPDATPMAGDIGGEIARRFNVGMNQGEAAYHTATYLMPAVGEVKGALELGRFAKAGPAKYIKMGATPEKAAYLAGKYDGMGHHSIAPRRAKLVRQVPAIQKTAERLGVPQLPQKLFGDATVSRPFMDSRFNVVKPGVERGQMYRRHFGLDDYYYGGRVPAEFGGGGWSGRKLGWTKYGPVERLWYGTPGHTKALGLGVPATFDALGRVVPGEEDGR